MRKDITKRGNDLYFDYYHGHVIKCDIGRDEMETWLYDRDNGPGAAEAVVVGVRAAS